MKEKQNIIFYKKRQKDDLPLKPPNLFINEGIVERVASLKLLSQIFGAKISWNCHILLIGNKVSKNIGVLQKAKHILSKDGSMSLYFAIINSYLNYSNIAMSWKMAVTAVAVIKNNKALNTTVKMKDILNVFELNIYQMFILVFPTAQGTIPSVFGRSKRMTYAYPPRLREGKYI